MNKSHMRKASPILLLVYCSVVISILNGCASKELEQRKFVLDTTEEKFLELKNVIATLTEEIKEMRSRASREVKAPDSVSKVTQVKRRVNPQPTPQPPVDRLTPDMEEENAIGKEVLGFDDDSVADSGQESMHYYLQGLELLEEKKYDEALQNWRRFLSDNPQHVYADRAQFLISDTHFKNKEYGLVIVATNLLEARYPYSLRLPEALYKRALSYISMNQQAQARSTFQNLLKKYPSDPFSGSASRQLAQLSMGAASKKTPSLMPEQN